MAVLAGFHAVMEALRAGRAMERVTLARGVSGPRIEQLLASCQRRGVPVRWEDRAALDRMSGGGVHQGIVAESRARAFAGIEDVMAGARLIVLLDGVEDPHNLGAILRTAHAAGAAAVVIPERRAAPLTPAAAKAASGAVEHLPLVRVGNLNRALETFKKGGFWIYGLDERGEQTYDRVDYASPAAIVLGGEGKGLHQQVKKHCDMLVRIPLAGQLSSLNVSVAAGIALFEWKRRFGENRESGEGGGTG